MNSGSYEVKMILEIEKLLDKVVPRFISRLRGASSNHNIAVSIAKISQRYVEAKISEVHDAEGENVLDFRSPG